MARFRSGNVTQETCRLVSVVSARKRESRPQHARISTAGSELRIDPGVAGLGGLPLLRVCRVPSAYTLLELVVFALPRAPTSAHESRDYDSMSVY